MQQSGEVRWIYPGDRKCLPQRKLHFMALCILLTAQKWSALWTVRWGQRLEFSLRLGRKAVAKYEGFECQA